jgi:cell division protease FtsH
MSKRGTDKGWSWRNSNPLILLIVAVAVLIVWQNSREPPGLSLRYGEFKQLLHAPGITFHKVRVGRSEIRGEILTNDLYSGTNRRVGEGASPTHERTLIPFRAPRSGLEFDEGLQALLDERIGANYQGDDDEAGLRSLYSSLMMFTMLLMLLFGGLMLFRWMSGSGLPFQFGRSRHKQYGGKDTKVTFADAAGIEEAVAELREVVDFLQKPEKYHKLGGRIPKGVLLVGPPGTGKTLLAKAVAGEADVPFFSLSGSDFVEMFVGVGASRVRDLFREAESKAPCIIFIDELDALGRSRGGNPMNPHEEREQTLNQLLVEMDGFDTNRGVILMAATNRPETLDAALLRPGRFDRTVVVDRPDINGREAILKVHAREVKLADDVNLRRVASLTPGSVGADLANLVNEAALLAARREHEQVCMADFDEAVERGAVGLERKSRIMRPDEKRRVAYHEAGHALVACVFPGSDPVHKVSIIPRGIGALGYVLRRPEDDRHLMTKSELEGHIKVALGGTLAEELIYNEISNGATSDLQKANNIARRMVKEFGMSKLGRMFAREQDQSAFLRSAMGDLSPRDYSEQTAREIDIEVRQIIDICTSEVRAILGHGLPALHAVAERLIHKEVIDGAELHTLLTQHGFLTAPPASANGTAHEPSAEG